MVTPQNKGIKMRNFLLTCMTLLLISGCSSLTLSTDYDEAIDFSNFKTYSWHIENEHNTSSLKYLNSIMDQRIRATIDQQLQQKYTIATADKSDFLVNYSITVEERADIRTYNNYNGYYPGFTYGARYGTYGSSMAMGYSSGSETQVTHYKQGTLIIDIIDPKTDQLIWRGAADGRLPESANREKRDKLAQEYVSKILSGFPPKQ
ncbi:MAG: hypothetical protein methR_P1498 [Methyloprofundus sp.]|nr:MAG: hypothetical protein methR_P1498 [Methyloprofundus sp.]